MTEQLTRPSYIYGQPWAIGMEYTFADKLAEHDAEHNVIDGSLEARLRKETGEKKIRHWTHYNWERTELDKTMYSFYRNRLDFYMEETKDRLKENT